MNPRINLRLERKKQDMYKDYFYLVNLHRPEEMRMSGREIDLAAAFAMLGNFSVEPRSRKTKNFDLLKNLTGMSSSMISQYVAKLIEKKTLIKDEDGLVRLPDSAIQFVKVLKGQLQKDKKFVFNYDIEYEVQ